MQSMRRFIQAVLTVICIISLCACGKNPGTQPTYTLPGAQSQPSASPFVTTAATSTAETQTIPTTAPSTSAAETTVLDPTEPAFPTGESGESDSTAPSTEATQEETEIRERALAFLSQMDLRSRLCQLMIVAPEAVSAENPVLTPKDSVLTRLPVAGIMYQAKNMDNAEQLLALVEGHQEASPLPLFICVDEEGGRVARLRQTMGTPAVKSMFTYRADGTEVAWKNARTLAQSLLTYNFNTDFAPVADVWSNPENKVIGERAYSDDFEKAAQLIEAAVKGFQEEGIICTLKHFPGHGDTLEDSHDTLAYVNKTLETLRQEEFLPFIAGIQAGAPMVMVGHLVVPSVDMDTPATFSKKLVTDILRGELGFQGVIITDSLEMDAVENPEGQGEVCLKALLAGCDLLLCPGASPERLTACVDYLQQAVENGTLSGSQVDESVLRILELKIQAGLLD